MPAETNVNRLKLKLIVVLIELRYVRPRKLPCVGVKLAAEALFGQNILLTSASAGLTTFYSRSRLAQQRGLRQCRAPRATHHVAVGQPPDKLRTDACR